MNAKPVEIGETVTVTGQVVDVEERGPSDQLVTIAIRPEDHAEPNRGKPIAGNRPSLTLAKGGE